MTMKKIWTTLIALVLVLAAAVPVFATAGGETVLTVSGETPRVDVTSYDTWLTHTFRFKNVGAADLQIKSIDILYSTDLATFPFDVKQESYYKDKGSVTLTAGTETLTYDFSMRVRADVTQGYYKIPFKIEYTDTVNPGVQTVTLNAEVLITNSLSGGGGGTAPSSMPRLIITNFSTNPANVVAGEEFTLSVTFKNTSGDAAARNIKAQMSSDGTFSPVQGSTTMFIDSIGPGGTATKSLRLKVKSDVSPGSYSVSFALNFDVAGAEPVSDSEVLAIPVTQIPKIQVSALQVYPAEIFVGQDLNVMASINNTGKAKLYNVNVAFADASGAIAPSSQYIGNIEPGATGNIDVYLSAQAEGGAELTMTVTYEDETGTPYTYTDSYATVVMQRQAEPLPGGIDDMPVDGGNGNGKTWPWLLLIPAAGAGVGAFLILNKKKNDKKRRSRDRRIASEAELEYLRAQQEQQEPDGPASSGE